MRYDKEARRYHKEPRPGKIEVVPTKPSLTQTDLSLAYTPGVAVPCLDIKDNPERSFDYTSRGNLIAVITNGSAVLGLGRIGPLAGKPVMEGKAVLFKRFANIDVFDLEIDTDDPDEFIGTGGYASRIRERFSPVHAGRERNTGRRQRLFTGLHRNSMPQPRSTSRNRQAAHSTMARPMRWG